MILTQLSPQYAFPLLRPLSKPPSRGIRIIYKTHGKLYREGEKLSQLFFLIEGEVTRYKKNIKGHQIELSTVECGEFICLQNSQNPHASSHSAKVCRPSRLLVIPLVQLPDFIKDRPALKVQIIDQLISQVDRLNAN